MERETSRGRIEENPSGVGYRLHHSGSHAYSAYDWGEPLASEHTAGESLVVVQFKNRRIDFFRNPLGLRLNQGDLVTVSTSPGHDIGSVSLTGWLADREARRLQVEQERLGEVYRLSSLNDLERWVESTSREHEVMLVARSVAEGMGLQMKVCDAEIQGDGAKATFYYSAESRVDFRDMVRQLASQLHFRIEMRQIGPRQEAARLGGLGPCGQRLCCARWQMPIRSVTTATIKAQDLTPNMQKLAGQCGKLKCCLNFELDAYVDAKARMPKVKEPLPMGDGTLTFVKQELFRQVLWFATDGRQGKDLIPLTPAQVRAIQASIAESGHGGSIADYRVKPSREVVAAKSFSNVIEEDSISRFDGPARGEGRRKKRKGGQGNPVGGGNGDHRGSTLGGNSPTPKGNQERGGSPRVGKPRGERRPERSNNSGEGGTRPRRPRGGAGGNNAGRGGPNPPQAS